MEFWQGGSILTVLIIAGLLLGCELLARVVPGLRRLGVPLAIIAGVLGLVLSQQVLGLFALDAEILESIVYHGLGILFISLSLRTAPTRTQAAEPGSPPTLEPKRRRPGLAMGFAITTGLILQAIVALLVILVLYPDLHPGFALLVPMGFEEGPGQALALGTAWEASGLRDGAQLGLIFAAIGYGWAVVIGIPLAIIGRRRGWLSATAKAESSQREVVELAAPDPGGLDQLSVQLALVGVTYLLTYFVCLGLATLFAFDPGLAATAWGFHFIFGAVVALGVKAVVKHAPGGDPIDSHLMGRVGGLTVDVVTCAALAAIQIAVFKAYFVPILLASSLAGVVTVVFCLWIGRRTWREADAPFEHTILWFGMSTGTLPTGLALLKVIDPDLRTPASTSAVKGSAWAIAGVAPLLLVLVPATVKAYGLGWPGSGWLMLGMWSADFIVLMLLWRLFGGLRFRRPLAALWPGPEQP